MSKSIFISYVYEDKAFRDRLKEWNSKKLLGEDVVVTYERGDYRTKGENAIKTEILSMIQGSSVVVVLLGENTHSSQWVNYEVECAISKNKKIIVLRVPGTLGGKPKLIKSYVDHIFEANKIKTLINE